MTESTAQTSTRQPKHKILLGAVKFLAVSSGKAIHEHDLLGYREVYSTAKLRTGQALNAYMSTIKQKNTLGYQAKMELKNTAIAVSNGIEALRNYNPDADLNRAQERALADQQALRGGRNIGL